MRLQLDIPEAQMQELERLMAETEITTRKDLFNHALTLFEWAINEKKRGRKIVSMDSNREYLVEAVMPILERVGR